jgi:hypothetical protein
VSDPRRLRIHAIYAVLDDVELFRASVRSIYDHVDRITVITTHDRDWMANARPANPLVATVLCRDLDPDRKIDLIVTSETNEARARNRAMDYAAPRRKSLAVERQSVVDHDYEPPDYFLIIDADEIYEAADFERLVVHVAEERRPCYRVACVRYFRRWNYRVEGYEWAFAFVRADWRIEHIRGRKASFPRRAAARVPGMPAGLRARLRGFEDIPAEVGVFHHGSYVGPRARIAAKLAAWGHAADVAPNWMEEVYDPWTTASRDFNPVYRDLFPSATEVPIDELPPEIADWSWSPEYLDR